MRAMTEAEFNDWRLHPMTQALMAILEEKRDLLRRQWEAGSFTDYEAATTALVNVGNVGLCRGYAFVSEFTYEDYISEISDGTEHVGPRPQGGSSIDSDLRAGEEGGPDRAA